MKSAKELSRELDAIKAALEKRELSELELQVLEEELVRVREIVSPEDTEEPISPAGKKPRSLRELKGLGKDLWRSIDVDEYLREERRSWR